MSPEELQELINNSVREFGHSLDEEAQAKAELDAMRKELEKSERWQTHAALQKEAKERASVLDAGIRKLTLEYFEQTDNKVAVEDAAWVRVEEDIDYDKEQAKAWAHDNLPEALELNDDIFKEYVWGIKNIKTLPFVIFKKEPVTCISKKRARFLAGENESGL
jgi:hypothetical protein